MALTFWVDATGSQLDRTELAALRQHARHLYENDTHILEDEADALVALGLEALPSLVTATCALVSKLRRPSRRLTSAGAR